MKLICSILFITLFSINLNANPSQIIETTVFEDTKVEEELFNKEATLTIKNILRKRNIPTKLSKSLIRKYYRNFNYKPFFVDYNGIKPFTFDLIKKIKEDPVLKPYTEELFSINLINSKIEKINSNEISNIDELIKLDIMLVSDYHYYLRYLSRGIIDWEAFQEKLKELDEEKEIIANWQKYNVRKNIRKLLYTAVKENDINYAINQVNYTFPKADELSKLILKYEEIALNGGYTKIPKINKSLRKGNYYHHMKFLRQRLLESNDLENTECLEIINVNKKTNNLFVKEEQNNIDTKLVKEGTLSQVHENIEKDCKELYDERVFEAVKSFQRNHGLIEDGIIGKNTIKRLNTPIEEKIEQLRINLERMRWMPRNLGEKYLVVNIPDYKLTMYNQGEVKLEMPVVVGEKNHPTPIFSHKISAVVLNPYWRIPQRIVKREIIPKLVEDPTYLEKQEIKAFENWSHKSMSYDISSVDWSMYLDNDLIGNSQEAPMRFIQIPGKKNPLGRMKFMFPNKYSVYLHDTPFKSLFKKTRRAFSHGCIRLSRPHELLKTIAQEDTVIDYDKAKEVLEDIEKTDIDLTKKIPVHIIYLTSWIDENGKVQFRDDIYNYDKIQSELIYNKSL